MKGKGGLAEDRKSKRNKNNKNKIPLDGKQIKETCWRGNGADCKRKWGLKLRKPELAEWKRKKNP